jgi:hypothetical protein
MGRRVSEPFEQTHHRPTCLWEERVIEASDEE